MKKKKKVDIVMIILIIIFLIVSYCYIQLEVQGKKYVNFFGYTFFRVVSGSMMNTIQINDFVIVKLGSNFSKDDIITFKEDNSFITHRVMTINEKNIITKGDANNTADDPIDKNDVLGKVVFIVPVVITIKVFTSPEVIGAIVVSIIGIWIVLHDKHDNKERKSSKEEN